MHPEPPALVVALMALGRDAPVMARALRDARETLGARAQHVRFAALLDEAGPAQLEPLADHADVLVASARRSGFAPARRRALSVALALEPRGVLVCDGDGLYPGISLAQLATQWLAGDPNEVLLPRRAGHTLPTCGTANTDHSESRVALEQLENAAGAILAAHPTYATADLQPGAIAMPAAAAVEALRTVMSRDFAWDLECALGLLAAGRTVRTPDIAAAPQEHTTFTTADLHCKLDMLARRFGSRALRAVLETLRYDPALSGLALSASLLDRVLQQDSARNS